MPKKIEIYDQIQKDSDNKEVNFLAELLKEWRKENIVYFFREKDSDGHEKERSPAQLQLILAGLENNKFWKDNHRLSSCSLFLSLVFKSSDYREERQKVLLRWLYKQRIDETLNNKCNQSNCLHFTARNGNVGLLELLFETIYTGNNSSGINKYDEDKFTALHQAALGLFDNEDLDYKRFFEIAEILREHGIDCQLRSEEK